MDRLVWKILLDLIVLASVALPCLFLVLWGDPYKGGFFEADLSIRLPYRQETVPETYLAGAAFTLIVVTVLAVEIYRDRRDKTIGERFLAGTLVPGWLWESYTTIGVFCFGAALQQLTTDSTKYVVGSLRPHFYDVCRPVYNISDPRNELGYIREYDCPDATEFEKKNVRLSFPSAHASFGLYTAVFFACYLQVKCKWRGSKLLRHGAQFAVFLAAWYVGLTRVQENYHRWSDIGFGYLVGVFYGFLVFFYVLKPKKYGLPVSWVEPVQPSMLPRPALAR